jgi:adenylate kinase
MIIFVCGLSKVGKSSLIEAARRRHFGWFRYLSAGDLLRALGRPTDQMGAADVLINQRVFVVEALKEIDAAPGDIFIDGHLLVETVDGPQLVPDAALDPLPLDGILVVETYPKEVSERRKVACNEISVDEAADRMALERIQARRLARRRGIHFAVTASGQAALFEAEIDKIIKRSGAPASSR